MSRPREVLPPLPPELTAEAKLQKAKSGLAKIDAIIQKIESDVPLSPSLDLSTGYPSEYIVRATRISETIMRLQERARPTLEAQRDVYQNIIDQRSVDHHDYLKRLDITFKAHVVPPAIKDKLIENAWYQVDNTPHAPLHRDHKKTDKKIAVNTPTPEGDLYGAAPDLSQIRERAKAQKITFTENENWLLEQMAGHSYNHLKPISEIITALVATGLTEQQAKNRINNNMGALRAKLLRCNIDIVTPTRSQMYKEGGRSFGLADNATAKEEQASTKTQRAATGLDTQEVDRPKVPTSLATPNYPKRPRGAHPANNFYENGRATPHTTVDNVAPTVRAEPDRPKTRASAPQAVYPTSTITRTHLPQRNSTPQQPEEAPLRRPTPLPQNLQERIDANLARKQQERVDQRRQAEQKRIDDAGKAWLTHVITKHMYNTSPMQNIKKELFTLTRSMETFLPSDIRETINSLAGTAQAREIAKNAIMAIFTADSSTAKTPQGFRMLQQRKFWENKGITSQALLDAIDPTK